MPYEVAVDDSIRAVVVTVRGAGSATERLAVLRRLASLRGDERGVLWDARAATDAPVRIDVRAFAEGMRALRDSYPRGLALVAGDEDLFRTARTIMAVAAVEGVPGQAFRAMEEARAWLGDGTD